MPFENMVCIGDGETDVPSFKLVRDQGGLSIAVFRPNTSNARCKARWFLEDGRVHCVALADYSERSVLGRLVKISIDPVARFDDAAVSNE